MKELFIVTGPPGAGKLRLVYESKRRHWPIYCCYHYNKKEWRSSTTSAILLAYSPAHQAKSYWMDQAEQEGFTPHLYTVRSSPAIAMKRMMARPKNNDLQKEINDWFRNNTPHSNERLLTGPEFDPHYERRIYTL